MISKPWRDRLLYTALSAFLVWHTLAIVVAPAPDTSVIAHSLRRVLQPYLTLLRLDNQWNFYAPNPGRGHQFRYLVEDAAGTRHAFTPTDELSRIHPSRPTSTATPPQPCYVAGMPRCTRWRLS